MTIYAAFKNEDGKRVQTVYSNWDGYLRDTYSPDTETYFVTDFKAKSQAEARQIAIEWQWESADIVNNDGNVLAYSEYAALCDALENLGRRWGLLQEFRENGII